MGKTTQRKTAQQRARKTARPAVKDLAPRRAAAVKGGQTSVLMRSCASGQHIKDAIITV